MEHVTTKKQDIVRTTKQGRSLMSVLFKDGEERTIKTKRKTVKAKVEKKRPKCPDGYVINHKLGLCERRGLRKSRGRIASPEKRTYRAKTVKIRPSGDSYYETVTPLYMRQQPDRAKTAKLRPAIKQPTMKPRTVRPNVVKPRYSFRNTPFNKPKTEKKRVRLIEPSQMVRTQKPEYISLKDYLKRNQNTAKKTYRKTPAKQPLKSALKTAPKTAPKTVEKKKAFF